MFENYTHTKEDLEAVEEALEYLERPELDFIFKDRGLIKNTLVISYDSKELFIWTKLKHSKLKRMPCRVKGYSAYRIPHKIKVADKHHKAWCGGLKIQEIEGYLPRKFKKNWYELPQVSGGLLKPFTKIHRKLKDKGEWPNDPYHTRESYLDTIIHEFGHVYYNQHKLWWFSYKDRNLEYMRTAATLYRGKRMDMRKVHIKVPSYNLGEVFAFCVDYTAATLFWPNHREDIEIAYRTKIKNLIREEKKKNLNMEDSVLEDQKRPHNLSTVLGKIIIEKYPDDWPDRILGVKTLV